MSAVSRFYENEDGIPWEMWEQIISRAMASERGQRALALLEEGLLALPQPRLISGNLFYKGEACGVGAAIAAAEAKARGVSVEQVLRERSEYVEHEGDETGDETAIRARGALGWSYSLAWHLAYVNDEEFRLATPEERHALMLAYVRRAQDKVAA